MKNVKEVLNKRLEKVNAHFKALKEYKEFIENLGDIYNVKDFEKLNLQERAVLEAYLKRFASLQDYLGAKVFPLLLENKGIIANRMSEVVSVVEKEGIIDLDIWIKFRQVRNELEHDYPDDLEEALEDLKYCIDNFDEIEEIVKKVFDYAKA
jgi:hypothetical protein